MRETLDANAFLTKLDHLPMAVMALNRNRESLARATATCSNRFDRVLKAHAAVPSAAVVEELLAAPPKGMHDMHNSRRNLLASHSMSANRFLSLCGGSLYPCYPLLSP